MPTASERSKVWTTEEKYQFYSKIAAMCVGNCMEWYDFAVFGALADIIGNEFFPGNNENLQLLQSLSVFGAAFIMRPLGGILMGWIGDTVGRKRALEISIALMLIPSFLMGLLPTYNQIGYAGTILLVFMRLLQGIAVGGELVGAFIFTVEATQGENQGFWGAVCKASGSTGTSIGMGFAALLRGILTDEQMHRFGWRIPFLIGIIFGVVGVWLRSRLQEEENDEFGSAKTEGAIEKYPICAVLSTEWKEVILVVMTASFWGVGFYSCFVWLGYYLSSPDLIGGEGVPYAWTLNFCANIALVVVFPMAGMMGDLAGRVWGKKETGFRIVMFTGAMIMLSLGIPAFFLITTRKVWCVIIGQSIFILSLACFGSNLPAFMVSLFPVTLRYSGVGLGYNIANAVFSGSAPLIQTTLVMTSNDKLAGRMRPALYLITMAIVAIFGLLVIYPCVINLKKRALRRTKENEMDNGLTVQNALYSCVCVEDDDASMHSNITSNSMNTEKHNHMIVDTKSPPRLPVMKLSL